MKLWDKGFKIEKFVERFTAGEDPVLDMRLLPYDIKASKVHAEVLKKAGVLSEDELKAVGKALDELLKLYEEEKVRIRIEDEDCHTVIENFLVERLGDVGKKIHTARSRNDQVLTALRLYYRDELTEIRDLIADLKRAMEEFSNRWGAVSFPGFTHTRKAMPTDFRTWIGAYSDLLDDDLRFLEVIVEVTDVSPLGTGAGYGVPMDIDREMSAEKLGFRKVQRNPIHAQLSRGKYELMILQALSHVTLDLNRLSSDVIFLSFLGFIVLPDEITTGSSIMPQKKNPDVLELIRGYHHRVVANARQVEGIVSNMIMGYHRDFQLLKRPVFDSFDVVKDVLRAARIVVEKMEVDEKRCGEELTPEVFATHEVYELVKKGLSFRDAYRIVAERFRKGYNGHGRG